MPKGYGKKEVHDTETFILKARKVHGDKFDYQKTNYVKSSLKVIISCPSHGDFQQTPNNHLSGFVGCKSCVVRTPPKDREYWVKLAESVHEDSYDYSLFNPTGAFTKTTVICNATGTPFEISPDGHVKLLGEPNVVI